MRYNISLIVKVLKNKGNKYMSISNININDSDDIIDISINDTEINTEPADVSPETLSDTIERLKSEGKLTVTTKKKEKPETKEQWLKKIKYDSDLFVKEFDMYNELTDDEWLLVIKEAPITIKKYIELDVDYFDLEYLIYKIPEIKIIIMNLN